MSVIMLLNKSFGIKSPHRDIFESDLSWSTGKARGTITVRRISGSKRKDEDAGKKMFVGESATSIVLFQDDATCSAKGEYLGRACFEYHKGERSSRLTFQTSECPFDTCPSQRRPGMYRGLRGNSNHGRNSVRRGDGKIIAF